MHITNSDKIYEMAGYGHTTRDICLKKEECRKEYNKRDSVYDERKKNAERNITKVI